MKKTGMIDVGNKRETRRMARARAFVRMDKEIIERIKKNDMPKGDVLESARVAAILACKKTASLIPLCHNIEVEYAGIDFKFKQNGIIAESLVKSTGKTGVEMEALISCTMAALTIYDMCKMFSKDIEIQKIVLLEKRGGKSGIYKRKA